MDTQLFEAVVLAGLILHGMITMVVVLLDLQHEPQAPPPAPIVTGVTAQGVPWVAGP